jgi:hypothetical protein
VELELSVSEDEANRTAEDSGEGSDDMLGGETVASGIAEIQSPSRPDVVQSLYDNYRSAYEWGKDHIPIGGPLLSLAEWTASAGIGIASFGQLDLQDVDEGIIGRHVVKGLDDILGGLFLSFRE